MRYGTGSAATWQSTRARTSASSGSIVAGPREQFSPTTSAPASASLRHDSAAERPSRVSGSWWIVIVITVGSPVARIASSAIRASSVQLNVSPISKSAPSSAAHAACSSNIARTVRRASSSGAKTFVLQRLPASSVPVSRATSRGELERPRG